MRFDVRRTPGTNNWIEFGQARQIAPSGSTWPTDHWFWARSNGGNLQEYDLNITFVHGTAYNATIKLSNSNGYWEFWQGGALYGLGSNTYPAGPIRAAQMGAK